MPPSPSSAASGAADPAPGTAAAMTASVDLPLDASSCGEARRTTRQLLTSWGLTDPDLAHDAAVVVSELVGNAVRHDGTRLALELALDGDGLTIAVRDGNAVLPRPVEVAEDAENGRGMAIVAAITVDWGAEDTGDGGKRVWARLALPTA